MAVLTMLAHKRYLLPAAKSLQSCPTLCDPMDCSLLGFSVHEILQARTLEWVAISFSNAWKWKVKVKSLNRVWLLVTPWTAAHQAPPSMGFSGQRTGVGCHCLLPKRYLLAFINPVCVSCLTSQVDSICGPGVERDLRSFHLISLFMRK